VTARTYERLEVREASSADLDAVVSMLEEAARWMVRRGIEGWTPDGFSRERIAVLMEIGEDVPGRAGRTASRDLCPPVV
jgi:hypothetical protein